MSASLIGAFLISIAAHVVLVLLGPGIRPPDVAEWERTPVEVGLVRREVPIPDALKPKPIPPVPLPQPLDLDRLLERDEGPLSPPSPALAAEPSLPEPGHVAKRLPPIAPPKLDLPQPVLDLEGAVPPGPSPGGIGEVEIPVGRPDEEGGLSPEREPLSDRDARDRLERTLSRLSRQTPSRRGEGIRGPAADRQIVFRPPPPKVKIFQGSEDIELRFWVLPDGTVGRVVPVRRGNAYLEGLAATYLKRWRFSPLSSDVPPHEEWGVISFRFRVR